MNNTFFNKQIATKIIAVVYKTNTKQRIKLLIKRDDLIHPLVSGNKWRKLKHNIHHALEHNYQGIASFGGAFSNHIFALSAAGQIAELKTLGFIRTHQLDTLNPTLAFAKQQGMQLVPLSRLEYRRRHEPDFLKELQQSYPSFYFVPEGGTNALSEPGLLELCHEIKIHDGIAPVHSIACAVGSGGTVTGLAKGMPDKDIIGVAAVNDEAMFKQVINNTPDNVRIHKSAIGKGYGKFDNELSEFCLDFYRQTGVPIEPVYTGKLFFALCYQRDELNLSNNDVVLAIHTGGLQGIAGQLYRQQLNDPDWRSILGAHVAVDV